MRHETEHKSFREPEETREFPNGRAEIISIGSSRVAISTGHPEPRTREVSIAWKACAPPL